MPIRKVLLTLEEPFTCSSNPVVSNEIHTVDHIPATIVRGAIYSALMRANRSAEVASWLGVGAQAARYSSAMPLCDGFQTVPMPFSFVNDKGDSGFGGKQGVLNLLWFDGTLPPEKDGAHRLQWTRPAKRWLMLDELSNPNGGYSIDTESQMHVGLHYERQSSRKGALFSRSEIPAGTQFSFSLDDPTSSLINLPSTVYLGKRRSAGSGAAKLQFDRTDTSHSKGAGSTGEHVIHFLSDCLVTSNNGGWEVGLSNKSWGRLLGKEIQVDRVIGRSASRQVFGWSNTWGRPRETVTAIAAGSVYRIVTKKGDATARLAELEAKGLGARTEEGFGWIAVNPQWLFSGKDQQAFGKGSNTDQNPEPQRPLNWPGLENIERERARSLVNMSREIQNSEARKLAELASLAGRSSSVTTVFDYLRVMAGRDHPRGWETVLKLLNDKKVMALQRPTELRFVLNSAATLSRKEVTQ